MYSAEKDVIEAGHLEMCVILALLLLLTIYLHCLDLLTSSLLTVSPVSLLSCLEDSLTRSLSSRVLDREHAWMDTI